MEMRRSMSCWTTYLIFKSNIRIADCLYCEYKSSVSEYNFSLCVSQTNFIFRIDIISF